MAVAGQAQMMSTVAEIVTLCAGLAGIYFVGTIVFAAAQSHLGAVSGQPRVVADLIDQIIPAVICLAVVLTAQQLGNEVAHVLTTTMPTNASAALALWRALASFVVNTVIYSAGASLAVGFATGAFSAQLAVFAGQPRALSTLWTRLLMVLGTGTLVLVSVTIANALVHAVP